MKTTFEKIFKIINTSKNGSFAIISSEIKNANEIIDKLVLNYNKFDLFVLDGSIILQDDMNQLKLKVKESSIDGAKKFFVIKHLERLSIKHQNELLVLIEELKNESNFLFSITNFKYVIPTIKSRIQVLEIPIDDQQTLLRKMKEKDLDEIKFKTLLKKFTSESIIFEKYNDEKCSKIYDCCVNLIKNKFSNKDLYNLKHIIETEFDLELFIDLLTNYILVIEHKKNKKEILNLIINFNKDFYQKLNFKLQLLSFISNLRELQITWNLNQF